LKLKKRRGEEEWGGGLGKRGEPGVVLQTHHRKGKGGGRKTGGEEYDWGRGGYGKKKMELNKSRIPLKSRANTRGGGDLSSKQSTFVFIPWDNTLNAELMGQ